MNKLDHATCCELEVISRTTLLAISVTIAMPIVGIISFFMPGATMIATLFLATTSLIGVAIVFRRCQRRLNRLVDSVGYETIQRLVSIDGCPRYVGTIILAMLISEKIMPEQFSPKTCVSWTYRDYALAIQIKRRTA